MANGNPYDNLTGAGYVSQFAPLPTQQLMQSGQMLRQTFFQNQQQGDLLDEWMSNVPHVAADKELLNQMNSEIRGQLDGIDRWEHAGSKVRGLTKEVKRNPYYKQIMSNAATRAKYFEGIDERVKSGDLSEERAYKYKAMADGMFKGSVDEEGNLKTYQGMPVHNDFDFTGWFGDLDDQIQSIKNGYYTFVGKDGREHTVNVDTEERKAELIQDIVQRHIVMNPQLRGYLQDEAMMNPGMVDENGEQIADPNERYKALVSNLLTTASETLAYKNTDVDFGAFTPAAKAYEDNKYKFDMLPELEVQAGYTGSEIKTPDILYDKMGEADKNISLLEDKINTLRAGGAGENSSDLLMAEQELEKAQAQRAQYATIEEMIIGRANIDRDKLKAEESQYNKYMQESEKEARKWVDLMIDRQDKYQSVTPEMQEQMVQARMATIAKEKVENLPEHKRFTEALKEWSDPGTFKVGIVPINDEDTREYFEDSFMTQMQSPEWGTSELEWFSGKQVKDTKELEDVTDATFDGIFIDRDGMVTAKYTPFEEDGDGNKKPLEAIKVKNFNQVKMLQVLAKSKGVPVEQLATEKFIGTKLDNVGGTWDIGEQMGVGSNNVVISRVHAGAYAPYQVLVKDKSGRLEAQGKRVTVDGDSYIIVATANNPQQAAADALSLIGPKREQLINK